MFKNVNARNLAKVKELIKPNTTLKQEYGNMKRNKILLLIFIILLNTACAQETVNSDTPLQVNNDKYFGQNTPGITAEIFAPGIVSVDGRYEYGVSFSPDLEEIYFTGHKKGESASVYFSKLNDKKWTDPKKAELTKGQKRSEMEAFVNLSGTKIYFTAYDSRDVKIWCAARSGDWWDEPLLLDSPINDDMVFYSNEAKNGDLYYKNVSTGKLCYAPSVDGKFPEVFETGIEYGSHGFIAPSQDFILIDARKDNDNTKDKDIHVCFKKEDGSWSKPINLGSAINSSFNESCPSITPDGKYIFFSRYNEEGGLPNIYWVNADIIKEVKENAFQENSNHKFTNIKGAYLGQNSPSDVPEVFAPGLISENGRLHTSPAFSNDGNEIYWMVVPPQIMTMTEKNQGWTNPVKAAFSSGSNNQAPFVAHDDKIYFASARVNGNGSLDIWYVNKSDTGFSSPINLGRKVNTRKTESMPSVSKKNTLFYAGYLEGKLYNRGIFYSKFENGEYQSPIALPEQINIMNKNNLDYTPFIAPDESYLLFSSNRQNPELELCHIYISYKGKNGEWGKPIDLSLKMNFLENSKFPYVSPDSKYLFFSSADKIYWVDSKIIKANR